MTPNEKLARVEIIFGAFLKQLRERRGLTLRQVEEAGHVSNSFLSQVERGERGIPTFKVLARLGEVYGISPSELIKVAEEASKGKKTDVKVRFRAR